MTELAVTLLAALVVGALADRGLFGSPGAGIVERFGRALVLGLGLMGFLSMGLDRFGLGVRGPTLAVALGGASVLMLLAWRWTPRVHDPSAEKESSGAERGLTIFLVVLTVVTLAIAVRSGWVRPSFQFDALTRWMFKTKVIALDGSLLGPVTYDKLYWFTHQQYPPLVSHVAAVPAHFAAFFREAASADLFEDRIASALFPWFAVALTCLAYGAVARRRGRLVGAFAATWVATLPLIAYVPGPPPGSGAASALADIPLSLFCLAAGLAALDAVEDRRPRAALETGLLLGFAALTKNEGLPLVVAFGVALAFSLKRSRWRRTVGVMALAGGLYLLVWGSLMPSIPALDENYWGRLNADAVSQGLRRVPMIAQAIFAGLFDFRQWNVTWLAVVLLVGLGWERARTPALRFLLMVVVLQILNYGFAYLVSEWTSPRAEWILVRDNAEDPLVVLFVLTLGRLLLHVAPLAVVCATLAAPLRTRASG